MTVVCPTCNTEHEGRELIVLSAGGKKVVKPAAHLAPCGRACRGAPVPVDWVVTEWHDSGCDCSEYVAPRGGGR